MTVWLYPSSKEYPERGVSYGWEWTISTRPPGCFVETDIYQSVDRTKFLFNSKSPSQAAPCSAAHPCVCGPDIEAPEAPPPSPVPPVPPAPPGQVWTSPGGITYTSNPWLSCGLTSGFIYGPEGFPVAATLTYAIEKCSQLSISSGRECIGLRYTMDLNSVRQQYLGCYGLYTDSQSMRGADDDPEYFIIPGSR